MPESLDDLTRRLIDSETGFFLWWNSEERLDIYQAGLGWPLITTVIDGFGISASWTQGVGLRKSETLFRALGATSPSWSAVYIKHPYDAYAEIAWLKNLTGDELHPKLLEEFTANPADEAGSCFLGLYAGAVDDMVLFTYAPGDFLRISLFGRMKTAIPAALGITTAG